MTELYEQEQALYARELAAEISALPIRHQTVFVCRLQGYTFKEIGEVLLNLNAGEMGVGVERVRHLLFEAKKYIRKTIVEPPSVQILCILRARLVRKQQDTKVGHGT